MIGNSSFSTESKMQSKDLSSKYPAGKPRIQRASSRRHRSLKNNKSLTILQSNSTVHVSIRKSDSNRTNNDKPVDPIENLLAFSSILSTRYQQAQSNQSLFPQSLSKKSTDRMIPLKKTNTSFNHSSILKTSQNISNKNDLSINWEKNKRLDVTKTGERINTSRQDDSNASTINQSFNIKSNKVIPSQNDFTESIIRISNDSNNKNETQRSNIFDFMINDSNFSRKKPSRKNKKRNRICCCQLSYLCLFGSILGIILLGTIIAAIIVGILSQQKSTTTATTITTTMITTDTTTTITTDTTSTITTDTTSTTTTTTTTTTTNLACGSTCVNMTVSTSSRLAFYSFDNVTTDGENNYPLSGIALPTYVSGWVGSAISFNAFNAQLLTTNHIPLNSRSFTVDFWFYATNISGYWDFAMAGECTASVPYQCLFIDIRYDNLYMGFYYDDTEAHTNILVNQWYHAAFVYDNTTNERHIYLNGVLDGNSSAILLDTTAGNFTIGGAYIGGLYNPPIVYYSGYIDHFTISSRAKTACEVYLDALLACYFTFDSASPIDDSGPNFLTATNTGATSTTGRINQALQFSSTLSYITINGISALLSTNTAFTISMWINPTNVTGGATLIHASTQSNGQGSCLVMWGLTSSGTVSVNVIDSSNNTISATASSALPLNTWTHIAQTFSTTDRNYLYINGTLVTSANAGTGRSIGPYTFLGASPTGTSYCKVGSIIMEQFYGSIDDYRVYGVELNATDICRLANP